MGDITPANYIIIAEILVVVVIELTFQQSNAANSAAVTVKCDWDVNIVTKKETFVYLELFTPSPGQACRRGPPLRLPLHLHLHLHLHLQPASLPPWQSGTALR